jgi:enoyl-[acyl-carrier protein] reductase III
VDRIFGTIEREWGGLEILVSNAASGVLKPAKELTMHHFDWACTSTPRPCCR